MQKAQLGGEKARLTFCGDEDEGGDKSRHETQVERGDTRSVGGKSTRAHMDEEGGGGERRSDTTAWGREGKRYARSRRDAAACQHDARPTTTARTDHRVPVSACRMRTTGWHM